MPEPTRATITVPPTVTCDSAPLLDEDPPMVAAVVADPSVEEVTEVVPAVGTVVEATASVERVDCAAEEVEAAGSAGTARSAAGTGTAGRSPMPPPAPPTAANVIDPVATVTATQRTTIPTRFSMPPLFPPNGAKS
jgi:hypothetical protein